MTFFPQNFLDSDSDESLIHTISEKSNACRCSAITSKVNEREF